VPRQQVPVTDELRAVLECEGVGLESAFSDGAEPRGVVFICHVSLPGTGALMEPRQVVKFSQKHHALSRTERLKLATPQHYRHNYEDADGIHDDWRPRIDRTCAGTWPSMEPTPPTRRTSNTSAVT